MEINLNVLDTEQVNPNSMHIDEMTTIDMLKTINDADKEVAYSVEKCLPIIREAVDAANLSMLKGGRLIYIGAGTSGRLGILDASECPPTYGVEPTLVQGIIAGGTEAIQNAKEGAEDSEQLAKEDLINIELNSNDIVCGIAASGRTPFVIGGLKYANELGCVTIALCCVNKGKISNYARYPIEVLVGPEVICGSTRMKAGTAQKLVLNMLSTTLMIKKGKVYGNLMVDLKPTNEKLIERALQIIMTSTKATREAAITALKESNNNVKVAIIMLLANINATKANQVLETNTGNVSKTIHTLKETNK
ncbi:MAG: N-acetylmuramic acid 6-phosphate etherase [Erysipelotrichaceae bacterium]